MTIGPCQVYPHRQQHGLPSPGGVLDNALTGKGGRHRGGHAAGGTVMPAHASRPPR